jgi:hypothetical protein
MPSSGSRGRTAAAGFFCQQRTIGLTLARIAGDGGRCDGLPPGALGAMPAIEEPQQVLRYAVRP